MAFTKNDEAVSPVIGVILMVAITVILAAVIAAFVFGMTGNVQSTKVVTFTMSRPAADMLTITFQGGQDAAKLTGSNWTTAISGTDTIFRSSNTTVGHSFTVRADPNSHVVGVAWFTDGSQQVVIDRNI